MPLAVLGVLVELAWLAVFLQQLAVRAASPGMRLLKLQLVGFLDGRPVGWGRAVRALAGLRRAERHGDRAAAAPRLVADEPAPPGLARPRGERRGHRRAPAGAARRPGTVRRPPRPPPRRGPARRPGGGSPARSGARRTPAPVPSAVAGDPAVGPELAPLAAEPAPSAPARSASATPRTAPQRRTILDGWVAELDDGREIVVRGLVLLGRNPQPGEGEADAELVKLPDESRTVSKTHLALGVDDAGLFVVDRGSTNGSTVTAPGQPTVPVGAFHAVSVVDGSVVSIGDHWVRIRRTGA